MRQANTRAVVCMLAALAFGAHAQHAQHGHTITLPADVKWVDAPFLSKGAKVAAIEGPASDGRAFTTRLQLPANFTIAPHTHPNVERLTVLSGSIQLGMGDRMDESKLQLLPVGSIAIMQPGMPHFVITREAAILQLHGTGPAGITYIDPKDDPRNQ